MAETKTTNCERLIAHRRDDRLVRHRRRRIVFVRQHCRVEASIKTKRSWYSREVVGYARDVPNYEWKNNRWMKVGRSTYKYFVFGSETLRVEQHSQYGFRSLSAAEAAMRSVLTAEDSK